MDIDMKEIIKELETLLNTPSPTGNTQKANDFVKGLFDGIGITVHSTNKGALIATMEGHDNSRSVTLSGHIDTLGAMVKEIKENGRLKISQIGGYVMDTIEGEHVLIETMEGETFTGTVLLTKASSHVHGNETKSTERSTENMEVRIYEKVFTEKDVIELGIKVGDFVSFDSRTVITPSGYVKSRHLDDKAGVIAIWGIAKHLMENNIRPKYRTHFFISNYEEVGHGSSASIPEDTFEFIAVDMAAPGEGQTSDEFCVTICAKDSTGPYDLDLRKRLVQLAVKNKLDHRIDIYPYYGSDASAALRAGYDFKAGLIGPGVDASHSFERTHRDAIEQTIKLGVAYLTE